MQHRILVVDNEIRLAEVLAIALRHLGYRAEAYGSAQEVLDVLDNETADLVISDMRMLGIDGRQLLHEVKRRSPDIPVIIITAYTSMRDAVEFSEEGAFDCMVKPFDMADIAATIVRALK